MKFTVSWLCAFYSWLLRLYPRRYHARFADEMQTVFAAALTDAAAQGWSAIVILCGREVRDLPQMLFTEYWRLCQQWLTWHLSIRGLEQSDLPGVVPLGDGSIPHRIAAVTGRNPRLRRLFDLLFALLGLALAAPLFLVLPILIKLDSPGPILYRAPRIGKNGHPYTMYKFRSMYVLPFPSVTGQTSQSNDDPRITRVGRWARRYCLDEMPQLFNILKGDMSVFGPRPGLPKQSL